MRGERAHERQVAVLLRVVQAVAHDELVGDVEADVAHVDLGLRGVGLAEHRRHLDRRGAAAAQVRQQPREREARVDDVLDDEHVAPREVGVEVLEDAHDARGLGARAVGRDGHPVHLDVVVQAAGEVGHDHDRSLEDAHEEQVLARVVAVDLLGELVQPPAELLLGEEDVLEVVADVG
ncbi:hypothetical protein D3C74_370310 [compost metagenome]